MSRLASNIARKMGLLAHVISSVQMASMLCEIGLLGADTTELQKPFETLNIQQREAYFEQINDASTLLLPAAHLGDVTDIITAQYECWDEAGYPGHSKKSEIAIGARVLAVARDFWRWVDGRIVSEKLDYQSSLKQLRNTQEKTYDPVIVGMLTSNFETLISAHYGYQATSTELTPGMTLVEGVFSKDHRLILVEGHQFTETTIKRIRHYEEKQKTRFRFNVASLNADYALENDKVEQ